MPAREVPGRGDRGPSTPSTRTKNRYAVRLSETEFGRVSVLVAAVSMGSPAALSLPDRVRAGRAQVLRQRLCRGPHGLDDAFQPLVRQDPFDGADEADRADGPSRLVDHRRGDPGLAKRRRV